MCHLRIITFIKKSSCLPKSSARRFLALFHSKHHFLPPLSCFKLQNFVPSEGFTISGFLHHFLLLLNACATSASVAPRSFLPWGSSPRSPSCHFRDCVCYFLPPTTQSFNLTVNLIHVTNKHLISFLFLNILDSVLFMGVIYIFC